jgi:hypothetical protein
MIISVGFTYYQVITRVQNSSNDIIASAAILDRNAADESLEIQRVRLNGVNSLNLTAKNTGGILSQLVWIGVFDDTMNTKNYYKVNTSLNPVETLTNIGNNSITINPLNSYTIQILTKLGNIYHSEYPEIDIGGGSGTGNSTQYYVDYSQVDIHPNATVGTHSFFAAMKGLPDSLLNNLTESVPGMGVRSEWINVNAFDSTYNDWTGVGSTPYLGAQDQPSNYIYTSSNNADEGWFDFPSTTLTGSLSINITIYCNNNDGAGNDGADVWVDYTGTGAGTNVGRVAQHTSWQYDAISLGTHTVSEVNNLRVRFEYHRSGPSDDVRIDHVMIGIRTGSTNYELDLEAHFTGLPQVSNEYLSVYGGVQGTENLQLDVWNGIQYVTLIPDIKTGWNHVDVSSYHTGTTFNIRFKDTVQVGDIVQDRWEIDACYLNLWD